MYLLLYVDDMLLTGSNPQLIDLLLAQLSEVFRMKDMGSLQYFLGLQAHFHDNGVFLCQEKYATDLLVTAGMQDCSPIATSLPLRPDKVLGQDVNFSDPSYFRSLAGKLQYMTLTRPDIQYAVNFVCQKMHAPSQADFMNLKRILRYLKERFLLGSTIVVTPILLFEHIATATGQAAKTLDVQPVVFVPSLVVISSPGPPRDIRLYLAHLLKRSIVLCHMLLKS
ncbi:uncharacterized mitochondrial protein AtMg00810-like [Raphanus sativus]|uniref:Uncharacterized mitochondrial protein AtMg00810-like n=1 Tax=Raphanus sativus TaxID=3726 RepID=A0A9W3BRN4_RAPSA|nr:uncharacterized mitochondrial protein AtMg00810-like [Raphanus sativus]